MSEKHAFVVTANTYGIVETGRAKIQAVTLSELYRKKDTFPGFGRVFLL